MNNNNFGNGFKNDSQRKFHRIMRLIKFGKIMATVILLIFLINYLIGVN